MARRVRQLKLSELPQSPAAIEVFLNWWATRVTDEALSAHPVPEEDTLRNVAARAVAAAIDSQRPPLGLEFDTIRFGTPVSSTPADDGPWLDLFAQLGDRAPAPFPASLYEVVITAEITMMSASVAATVDLQVLLPARQELVTGSPIMLPVDAGLEIDTPDVWIDATAADATVTTEAVRLWRPSSVDSVTVLPDGGLAHLPFGDVQLSAASTRTLARRLTRNL